MRYRNAHGKTELDIISSSPEPDGLESSMADWLMGEYLERSAYQILSSMHRRVAQQPADFFDAAIGAVAGAANDAADATELEPAETFMRACEAKGDFSFIFSGAPRDASGPPLAAGAGSYSPGIHAVPASWESVMSSTSRSRA
jgi:hypothetical protein